MSFYGYQNIAQNSIQLDMNKTNAKYRRVDQFVKQYLINAAPFLLAVTIFLITPLNKTNYVTVIVFAPAAFAMSLYVGIGISIGKINSILILTLYVSVFKILSIFVYKLPENGLLGFLCILSILPYLTVFLASKKVAKLKNFYVVRNVKNTLNLGVLGFIFWVGTGLDVVLIRFVLNSNESGAYMISATVGRTVLFVYLYFVQSQYPIMSLSTSDWKPWRLYMNGILIICLSAVFIKTFGSIIATNVFAKNLPTFSDFTFLYIMSLVPLVYVFPQLQLLTIDKNFKITPMFLFLIFLATLAYLLCADSKSGSLKIMFVCNCAFMVLIYLLRINQRIDKNLNTKIQFKM
jgi:hypothetical protein